MAKAKKGGEAKDGFWMLCAGSEILQYKTRERFMTRIGPISEKGCMPFLGCPDSHGYGQFKIKHRIIGAHRVAWELHNGPIPLCSTAKMTCS